MGSINSFFLWGLLLLVIPVLVHLFQFRLLRRIEFSNVPFLQAILLKKIPRSRIRKFLLLILRMLFVVSLVLIFLNPRLFTDSLKRTSSKMLLVDNSLSLLDDCGSLDCITLSKELVMRKGIVLDGLNLKFNDDFISRYYHGIDGVSQSIAELSVSKTTFGSKSKDFLFPEVVSVLSDFKTGTLKAIDELIADSVAIELLPLNHNYFSNVFVDTIYFNRVRADLATGKKIIVHIKNSGYEDLNNVLVRLITGTSQLGSSAFSIKSNEVLILEFPVREIGDTEFMLRIDDKRAMFDNDFYFSLPKYEAIEVTLISNQGNDFIEKLYANSDIFLFNQFSSSSINYEVVKNSDMVIIDSFELLPDWLSLSDLKGDILFIPEKNISIESYERVLQKNLFPLSDTISYRLSHRSLENPFFNEIFENIEERITLPSVNIRYGVQGVVDVLLMSNLPYLVRFPSLEGGTKVYFFTGGLDPLKGNSVFLPLMYRIAEESKAFNEPIYYPLSNSPIVFNSEGFANEMYRLVGPESTYIPEVYFNNTDMVVSLPPDLVVPGHYILMAGADTVRTIGLNIPKSASLVDYHSAEQLKEIYKGNPLVSIVDTSSLKELEANLSNISEGVPIWKYALLLALMFLVAETAIHRWVK